MAIQGMIRALMKRQKDWRSSAISERFKGEIGGMVPDSGSGLKTGDLRCQSTSFWGFFLTVSGVEGEKAFS